MKIVFLTNSRMKWLTTVSLLVCTLFGLTLSGTFALDLETLPYPLKSRPQKPIQMDKKNQSLEELLERGQIPYGFPPTIPFQGINIAGLNPKSAQILGENYFVVLNNTHLERMADIYRENRENGKANYITIDCVLHPYIAFTNRLHAQIIKKNLLPMMDRLLRAMLHVAMVDYKQADDADIRADIEANIAFLSVGLKLVDSSFAVPQVGKVPVLVAKDYDSVIEAQYGQSAVFDTTEDFRLYRPIGFYRAAPELIKFYRLKMWLSRLAYPINESAASSNSGNSFRRSVLIYRCLEQSTIDGKPGYDYWMRLVKGLFMLGSQIENSYEKNVYVHDYRAVFRANSQDLKVSLHALTEPLNRTKLLLAVRRQKPVSLGAASIFDIEDNAARNEAVAKFRLIPNIGSPEEYWLRSMGEIYPTSFETGKLCPLGLIDLTAWGCIHAGNTLLDSAWACDPNLPKYLVELRKWVLKRLPAGQTKPVENKLWSLVSTEFHLLPDGIQSVLRTESWASRRMESALCAWLDSMIALAPESVRVQAVTKNAQSGKPGEPATKTDSAKGPSTAQGEMFARGASKKPTKASIARRVARGHFLDPSPDMFRKLKEDAVRIQREAQGLEFSLEPYRKDLEDYVRFFARLEQISQQETRGEALSPNDLNLLSNFDAVLERIDTSVAGVLPFGQISKSGEETDATGGVNLCLGGPGRLYVVLQNRITKEWTLARGAVYTYYEVPGAALSTEQLLQKVNQGHVHLPFWTERFDVVQTGK